MGSRIAQITAWCVNKANETLPAAREATSVQRAWISRGLFDLRDVHYMDYFSSAGEKAFRSLDGAVRVIVNTVQFGLRARNLSETYHGLRSFGALSIGAISLAGGATGAALAAGGVVLAGGLGLGAGWLIDHGVGYLRSDGRNLSDLLAGVSPNRR